MPDIFVPVDTTKITPYYRAILRHNLPFRFAVRFVDAHRVEMGGGEDIESVRTYFENSKVLESFVNYASQRGVPFVRRDYQISKNLIEAAVYSNIARFVWGNRGMYLFLQPTDDALNAAIKALYTKKVLPQS